MQCIARTIKDFEKALHAIFPSPFVMPVISLLFASSAPSISPLGPTDFAKGPQAEARSARMKS